MIRWSMPISWWLKVRTLPLVADGPYACGSSAAASRLSSGGARREEPDP